MKGSVGLVLVLAAAGLWIGCGGGTPADRAGDDAAGSAGSAPVEADGMVVRVDLEGGFFGIVADDGTRYDPVKLSPEFEVDSLRVHFAGTTLDSLMTSHMWGTPVRIDTIARR